MRALQWRFGDGLRWRTVMIGLSEDTSRSERSGYTPERRVQSWLGFQRRFGMPVLAEPRTRLVSSGRACRAVVAARAQSRELSDALLRRIRLAWFTSTLLLDEDEGLAAVAALVPGLDVAAGDLADRRSGHRGGLPGRSRRDPQRRRAGTARDRAGPHGVERRPRALHGAEHRLPLGRALARGGRLAAARRLRRLHREPRAVAAAAWRRDRRRGARGVPRGPHHGRARARLHRARRRPRSVRRDERGRRARARAVSRCASRSASPSSGVPRSPRCARARGRRGRRA